MTTDYKSGGILLGLALLISLPSLGWAQLVPAQEPEPISYQSRLSELRKTEVALDAGTIAGPSLPLLLQELDVQRSWEDNGADRTFSALVDATDGRMIGWTSLSVKELA